MKLDHWLNKKIIKKKVSEESKKPDISFPTVLSIRNDLPLTELTTNKKKSKIKKPQSLQTNTPNKKDTDFDYFIDYYSENL